VETDLPYR